MLELDGRLREQFEEIVRDLELPERLDDLVQERRRRRIRRQRSTAGALAALGIVVAAAVMTRAVLPGGGEGSSVVAGAAYGEGAEPLFLVPGGSLPKGFGLLEASGGDQPGKGTGVTTSAWDGTQRWVRFDDAHEHPAEVIDLQWRHAPATGVEVSTSEGSGDPEGSEGAEEPGWVERLLDDGHGAPLVVRVSGHVAPDGPDGPATPLPQHTLEEVLDDVVPAGNGAFRLTEAPEGFEMVGEWADVARDGTNPRVLAYGDPDTRRGFQLQIVSGGVGVADSLETAAARLVVVRGSEGIVTPDLTEPPSLFAPASAFIADAELFVQWTEPSGETVTLTARGMPEDELLAVADSLEAVDAATWFALQRRPAPETTSPTTGAP